MFKLLLEKNPKYRAGPFSVFTCWKQICRPPGRIPMLTIKKTTKKLCLFVNTSTYIFHKTCAGKRFVQNSQECWPRSRKPAPAPNSEQSQILSNFWIFARSAPDSFLKILGSFAHFIHQDWGILRLCLFWVLMLLKRKLFETLGLRRFCHLPFFQAKIYKAISIRTEDRHNRVVQTPNNV